MVNVLFANAFKQCRLKFADLLNTAFHGFLRQKLIT